MDIVAGVQGSRINDQRANFPGLRGNQRNVMSQLLSEGTAGRGGDVPDDNFFDQLMRCQVRSPLFVSCFVVRTWAT